MDAALHKAGRWLAAVAVLLLWGAVVYALGLRGPFALLAIVGAGVAATAAGWFLVGRAHFDAVKLWIVLGLLLTAAILIAAAVHAL